MPVLIATARRLRAAGYGRAAALCLRCALFLAPASEEALRLSCAWAIESGRYGEAERLCRRMLELAPEQPGAMWDLAQLMLLRGEVSGAVAQFRRHAALAGGPAPVTQAVRSRHLDLELARRRQPYFKRLSDVLVDTGYWTIIEGDVIYSDDTHGRSLPANPMVRGRVTPDGQWAVVTYAAPRTTVNEECIFVGGDDNYSHWLFRNLLKLSTLDRAGLLHTQPWLLNRDLRAYQREYLDLLEVRPRDRVLVERNDVIRCRRLVVPALLTNEDTISRGVAWIRERLARHMSPPETAGRLIYVSRRDVRRRTLLNEDELIARLSPLGFELVVPGEMSVVEQIRTFSGARLIVGTHGAAFTNIVYAPRNAGIVVITSTAIEIMDNFRRIAASAGQRMTTIVSDRYPDGARPSDLHADYLVDVEEVMRAVRPLAA